MSVIGVALHYEELCRTPTSANDGAFLYYFAKLNLNSVFSEICLRFYR